MSRKVNTSYTPQQVKAAFKVFEKGVPDGFVSMAALEQVRTPPSVRSQELPLLPHNSALTSHASPQALTTYGTEKLSLSDAQELLSQIEPDENGLVNYVEFVNMMTSS